MTTKNMSKRIFKYPLKIEDKQIIKMPLGYQILTVQIKDNVPCIWAIVDDKEAHVIDCKIITIGTGHCFDDYLFGYGHYFDNHPLDYIGTYQLNQLVFHVFSDNSPF